MPAALPHQALLAPCRVLGDVAGDKHGLSCRPRRQPDHLGDRVALPDHQIAASFAQTRATMLRVGPLSLDLIEILRRFDHLYRERKDQAAALSAGDYKFVRKVR